MTTTTADSAREIRLQHAFAGEERAALKLMMIVGIAVSAAIVIYILVRFHSAAGIYWAALTAVFALIVWVQYAVGKSRFRAGWQKYLFITLNLALVSFIILFPNPFLAEAVPPAIQLKASNAPFLFLVVSIMAFTYSPGAVAWAGIVAVAAWGVGAVWILSQPGSYSQASLGIDAYQMLPLAERLRIFGDPNFVDLGTLLQEGFVMLVFAGGLAAAVWRTRRLVGRQMRAERARANLSRYFSPGLIEELAESDEPLGAVREQHVGVLFADIVGFTTLSENEPPKRVIGLLRDFHGRMAHEVFAHGGTVDKYIGDAIMATFGTPRTGERDATNALACARAMLASVEAWNAERKGRGEPDIAVGIGLHFGPTVMGDIGDERRLEFAVVGDTVNVASRLEALTRNAAASLLVSDETVATIRRESGAAAEVLRGMARSGEAAVRGRAAKVTLWALDTAATAGD